MGTAQLRVGLCGIGLDAYWSQFEGLRARLEGYVGEVSRRLEGLGVDVTNLGLVDDTTKARAAASECRKADVGLLVLYVTTYALSSTVLPLVQRAGVPALVLNLQPTEAIDHEAFNKLMDRTAMTGEWLAYCSACPVPEIANVSSVHSYAVLLGSGPYDAAKWGVVGLSKSIAVELAAFLLSDRSACITGANMFADGGMTSQLISRESYTAKNLTPEARG